MKSSHSLIQFGILLVLQQLASAQGFLGHEVTIYGKIYDQDNQQPAWAQSPYLIATVLVEPGIEIGSDTVDLGEGGEGTVPGFDFDAFSVEIDSSDFEGFKSSAGNFNGLVIEDTKGTLPDFKSVVIDESVSSPTPNRILVSPNSIWINEEGETTAKDQFLRLLVTFAETNSVPKLSLTPSKEGNLILDAPTQLGARYRFEQSEDLVAFSAIDLEFTAIAPHRAIFLKPESAQMHYRLRLLEEPSIPLQSDFESGAEGWMAESTSGTQWELGTPSTDGSSSTVSGSQVWGTNLSGDFEANTVATLRSPLIDLSQHSREAALTFRYTIDAPEGEGGQLRFVDDAGSVLHTHKAIFSGSGSSWTPFRLVLPDYLQNRKFRIEFHFLSNDDDEVGAGWFIDDVMVL